MKRRSPEVGMRHTGLILIGVSTIVLAAAGETLWHAHAAASEGSWAAPTVGVAAAMRAAEAAAVAEANAVVNAMTAPIFKPFVFVELPLPDGKTLVHDAGLHMNDDGVVVAR